MTMTAEREAELLEALESVAWQYGYRTVRDGQAVLMARPDSTLEYVWHVLGWADPHPVTEFQPCPEKGCRFWGEHRSAKPDDDRLFCYLHSGDDDRGETEASNATTY